MRICIDGIGVTKLHGTGLYTYTCELLQNLFEMYPQPSYDLIWDESSHIDGWENTGKINFFNLSKRDELNGLKAIKDHITGNKINLFHSPNNGLSIPPDGKGKSACKYVITAHDLIAFTIPEMVDEKYLNRFLQTFPKAAEEADRIIAVSDSIKKQLANVLALPNDRIDVIYPGCSSQFSLMNKEHCMKFLKDNYHIQGDIILFAGSVHIRKNLETLLRVFREIKMSFKGLKLVLAGKVDGKRQEYYLELKGLAKDLGIENELIFTGTVEYKHMPYFYNASKCAVNLSDYEGFPMTAIEAISCGVPAICSNTASFIETVGDKALLVNAKQEKEVKYAILEALNSGDDSEALINKSNRVKKEFNWNRAIKDHIRLYESLLS